MKQNNRVFLVVGIAIASLWVYYGLGESFLAAPAERKERMKSVGQVKQEIVELLADILQQESKIIENSAQLQQVVCQQVRQIADNDKSSFFSQAAKPELQKYLQRLREIQGANAVEINRLVRDSAFVRSNGASEQAKPQAQHLVRVG